MNLADADLHTPRRLASWASGEIELHADTLEWLGNLPGPLCVLAIAGPLRSGKSCLMNHLFGAAGGEAFRVGGTIVSTTHGMWICAARPGCLPGVTGTVLLLDTEGLGALESDSPQREPQLFALTALLSSVVLYNSFGLVSDRAVERLAQLAAVASQCLETDAAGAVGRGFGQVRRQQQDAVGAGSFCGLAVFDRFGRAAAGRGDHRNLAGGFSHGSTHHAVRLSCGEREEFARATCRKQAGCLVAEQPAEVGAIRGLVERQIRRLEVRDGEGQQTGADLLGELFGAVSGHVSLVMNACC